MGRPTIIEKAPVQFPQDSLATKVRVHLSQNMEINPVGEIYRADIADFPSIEKLDIFVAPKTPSASRTRLDEMLGGLVPIKPTHIRGFYDDGNGRLLFGRLGFVESIGRETTVTSTAYEVLDSEAFQRAGWNPQNKVGELVKDVTRLVNVRLYPSEDIARLVTHYTRVQEDYLDRGTYMVDGVLESLKWELNPQIARAIKTLPTREDLLESYLAQVAGGLKSKDSHISNVAKDEVRHNASKYLVSGRISPEKAWAMIDRF